MVKPRRGLAVRAARRRRTLLRDRIASPANCPYFKGTGHCNRGCWQEPSCQTDYDPRYPWPPPALPAPGTVIASRYEPRRERNRHWPDDGRL